MERKGYVITILAIVIVGCLAAGSLSVITYNGLVTTRATAENRWATIKVQFERKIDLIPQLITVVENYTAFEQETLALITNLRTQWLQLNGSVNEQVNASSQLNTALSTLFLAVSERYPTLQASLLYQNLFDEITGTENRITQSKLDFNDAVTRFNVALNTFPGNIVGAVAGFTSLNLYAAVPLP
jgi:LemA protein